MLHCGIIEELESGPSAPVSYFFCQAAGGARLSEATRLCCEDLSTTLQTATPVSLSMCDGNETPRGESSSTVVVLGMAFAT